MDGVDVVLRKYDGRPHRRVTTVHLGEDRHGTWLGTPMGTIVTYSYGGKPAAPTRHNAVRLVPHDRWWCAVFFAAPNHLDVYCDITVPARWDGPSEVTLIDLDLDLVRYRDGRVELDDADEFVTNTAAFGYPAEVVTQAQAAAAGLHADLTAGAEPFGTDYRAWLEKL
ncbi:DUF402 domain-containing protein [Krasilnikovia sp. MM14-A1004]|uniref:DUF402 domain-containing protein n=1 Tax=Krasilnikovia sp. MM14-A1004 TaxID=3373541 RepID=UPI00399C92A8